MTIDKEQIKESIFLVIDELNEGLSKDKKLNITKSTDAVLYGDSGELDSLGLVTFLVSLEDEIEDKYDISFTIADEKAMSQEKSPFQSIGTLVDYLFSQFQEMSNEWKSNVNYRNS